MSYTHFNIDDREIIALQLAEGNNPSQIARILDRHPSSVYDEISRNSAGGTYYPAKAQAMADERRRDSKSPWKMEDPDVAGYVKSKLKIEWSPEQIAGRIKSDHTNDEKMRVSHETIYRWDRDKKGNGGNWHSFFRQSGKKRRKRYGSTEKRGRILDRVDIDERPKIVDDKTRLGDWEGDTVEGAKGSGYLATMVDRKSQYLVVGKSDTKKADVVRGVITRSMRRHKDLPCETITLDNGKEFADHKRLGKDLSADVYFAKPYHSWERGLNENTNGLLRQYFPKGTDFSKITTYQLKKAEAKLNDRPRKTLGYRTPREVMNQ